MKELEQISEIKKDKVVVIDDQEYSGKLKIDSETSADKKAIKTDSSSVCLFLCPLVIGLHLIFLLS